MLFDRAVLKLGRAGLKALLDDPNWPAVQAALGIEYR